MPKRHSRLYQRINNSPATLLMSGGITEIVAAFKWQFKGYLRNGYRIVNDNNERFTVQRGDDTVETWIESDPVQHRAPGGGPKPLAPEEATVKVAVTLLASQAEAMKELGQGNLSAGIRRMYTMTTMKYNYTTGTKGSVITLSDGRYADTVHGDSSEGPDANAALNALLDEVQTGWIATDETLGDLTQNELRTYVGAE